MSIDIFYSLPKFVISSLIESNISSINSVVFPPPWANVGDPPPLPKDLLEALLTTIPAFKSHVLLLTKLTFSPLTLASNTKAFPNWLTKLSEIVFNDGTSNPSNWHKTTLTPLISSFFSIKLLKSLTKLLILNWLNS